MSIIKVLSVFKAVAPLMKSMRLWLMSAGKFSTNRAYILLLFFIIVLIGINYIGLEEVTEAIELIDEISDLIGVVE